MKSFYFGILLFLVTTYLPLVPAPVPRCSPFIIINKLAEFSTILSDSNPYFPVPPCEYGGWMEALDAGDYKSVFVLAQPQKIPRHNFYEFIWLLKTGMPRYYRMLTGQESFVYDKKILREGYKHSTPYVRTNQIGTNKFRNPRIIDDKNLYSRVVGKQIYDLLTKGPDKEKTKRLPGAQRRPPRRPRPRPVGPIRHATTHSYNNRPSNGGGGGGLGGLTGGLGGLFNFNKGPKGGSRRPPRKSPPVEMPMIKHSTGAVTPPLPGGNKFEFLPKLNRNPPPKNNQVNPNQIQGGFLPAAPYFKAYDNLVPPPPSENSNKIQPTINQLVSSSSNTNGKYPGQLTPSQQQQSNSNPGYQSNSIQNNPGFQSNSIQNNPGFQSNFIQNNNPGYQSNVIQSKLDNNPGFQIQTNLGLKSSNSGGSYQSTNSIQSDNRPAVQFHIDEGLINQLIDPRNKISSNQIQGDPTLQQQSSSGYQSNTIQNNPVLGGPIRLQSGIQQSPNPLVENELLNFLKVQSTNQQLLTNNNLNTVLPANPPALSFEGNNNNNFGGPNSIINSGGNINSELLQEFGTNSVVTSGGNRNIIPELLPAEVESPTTNTRSGDFLPSGHAYRYFVDRPQQTRGRGRRPPPGGGGGRRPNYSMQSSPRPPTGNGSPSPPSASPAPPPPMVPSPMAPPQYQLVIKQETISPNQLASINNNNLQLNQVPVSSSLNFGSIGGVTSGGGGTGNNIANYATGRQLPLVSNSAQPNVYLQRAESRADVVYSHPKRHLKNFGRGLPTSGGTGNKQQQSKAEQSFPSFILNPRAANPAFTNRVTRTVPKSGTRFINNLPIRQYQWPDYVDNN